MHDTAVKCYGASFNVHKPGWKATRHQHPFVEILVLTKGVFDLAIGKEKFVASSGDAVVYPPNVPHNEQASSKESVELYCYALRCKLDPMIGYVVRDLHGRVVTLSQWLCDELHATYEGHDKTICAIGTTILAELGRLARQIVSVLHILKIISMRL